MNYIFWEVLVNIRNGQLAKKPFILQKKTLYTRQILNILWDEGFIKGYIICYKSKKFKIFLDYKNNSSVLKKITNLNKGKRFYYFSSKQIWKIKPYTRLYLFSTNKGILTLSECKKKKLGGKFICSVY